MLNVEQKGSLTSQGIELNSPVAVSSTILIHDHALASYIAESYQKSMIQQYRNQKSKPIKGFILSDDKGCSFIDIS